MTDFSSNPNFDHGSPQRPPVGNARNEGNAGKAISQPATSCEGVIDALRRQVVLYEQICALAEKQSAFVENGETEQLLAVLADRQRLIAGLTAINDQLEPIRQQWATFVGTLADAQKQSIGLLTRQIDSLRQSILEKDDQDRATLSAARDSVGRDLRKLSQSGQVARAYQSGQSGQAGQAGRMVGSESNAAAVSSAAANTESPLAMPGGPKSLPAQSRFTDRKG